MIVNNQAIISDRPVGPITMGLEHLTQTALDLSLLTNKPTMDMGPYTFILDTYLSYES